MPLYSDWDSLPVAPKRSVFRGLPTEDMMLEWITNLQYEYFKFGVN